MVVKEKDDRRGKRESGVERDKLWYLRCCIKKKDFEEYIIYSKFYHFHDIYKLSKEVRNN